MASFDILNDFKEFQSSFEVENFSRKEVIDEGEMTEKEVIIKKAMK